MNSRNLSYFFVTLLVLFLTGCFNLKQPSNSIDYYTLEYVSPEIPDLPSLPTVVRVERFAVAPAYNTRRMVYRDRSFVRNEYVYHQWRASPGDMVAFFLARDMRKSRLFDAILPYDSRLPATYVLEGSVDEFFEEDGDNGWKAALSIGITLTAEKEPDSSKKVYFQKTYHAEEPCKRKNAQALAEAMSVAMEGISREMLKDVYTHLKKNR